MATWFEHENARRNQDLHWPMEAQLTNNFMWRLDGNQVLGDTAVGGWPACRCCVILFQSANKSALTNHFSSAGHLAKQRELPLVLAALAPGSAAQLGPMDAHADHSTTQELVKLQLTLFGAYNPTLTFGVNGGLMNLHRAINAPLQPKIQDLMNDLRNQASQLGVELDLRKAAAVQQTFKRIQDTSWGEVACADDYRQLAQFFHRKRLDRLRDAATQVSLYIDEASDRHTKSVLVLCCTYIDRDYNFRSEFLEAFDVSAAHATSGEALLAVIDSFLVDNDLREKIDNLNTDGASNVNDKENIAGVASKASVAHRMKAAMKKIEQAFTTWWCLAHRENLIMGDVIKAILPKDFIKMLRKLLALLKSSATRYDSITADVAKVRAMVESLESSTRTLEKVILGLDVEDADEKAERLRLEALIKDAKDAVEADQTVEKLKTLGKYRRLQAYCVARWLGLFNTIDSIIAMYPFIITELRKEASLKSAKKSKASLADPSAALVEDEADDIWDLPDGKKWAKGEKAELLLAQLTKYRVVLMFLHDLSTPFHKLMAMLQIVDRPVAPLLYPAFLEFQQLLFNTALKFNTSTTAHIEPKQKVPEEAAPNEVMEVAGELAAAAMEDIEEDDSDKLFCCKKLYDDSKFYVECDNGRKCCGVQWYHGKCVKITQAMVEQVTSSGRSLRFICFDCQQLQHDPVGAVLVAAAQIRGPVAAPSLQEAALAEIAIAPVPAYFKDTTEQFWSREWRAEIVRAEVLEVRPVEELDWTRFQSVQACLLDARYAEESLLQVPMLSSFILGLASGLCARIGGDMPLLEALTLFNPHPVHKARIKDRASEFMRRLLVICPQPSLERQNDVLNACQRWFDLRDDDTLVIRGKAKNLQLAKYFGKEVLAKPELRDFALVALEWLRKLFATVVVETRFSARKLALGPLRCNLGATSLRGVLVLRDEKVFGRNERRLAKLKQGEAAGDKLTSGHEHDHQYAVGLLKEMTEATKAEKQRMKKRKLRGVYSCTPSMLETRQKKPKNEHKGTQHLSKRQQELLEEQDVSKKSKKAKKATKPTTDKSDKLLIADIGDIADSQPAAAVLPIHPPQAAAPPPASAVCPPAALKPQEPKMHPFFAAKPSEPK